MKCVSVFCGSSTGSEKIFMQQAFNLGEALARQNLGLIYGSAKVGLIGAVADGVLAQNGKVIGVLPGFLRKKEIAHEGLTELIVVNTMHERKTKMSDLCDGIIALPGGFGTLEELFEILTWAQLGLHQKPIALLNINGFYNDLLSCIVTMVEKGFLKAENQKLFLVSDSIDDILHKMKNYQPTQTTKWINRQQT